MEGFIAVHSATFTEEGLKALAKEKPPKNLSWKLTYCDFADNKFFCYWEAPNKGEIEAEFIARNIPFDTIYPVQIFNVGKGKLEK